VKKRRKPNGGERGSWYPANLQRGNKKFLRGYGGKETRIKRRGLGVNHSDIVLEKVYGEEKKRGPPW